MKSILNLTVILLLCFGCQAQSKEKNLSNDISNYMKALEQRDFSGSVLVAYKGQILNSEGYGYANKDANIKNTVKTVFDIGSITKQFTAAGILKLEDQGKLKVSDKITKYFNNVPENKSHMTLHHLLTHASGLPPAIGDDYQMISKEDYISRALASELLFPIGTQYEYSNTGYTLLAMIIEKVSGQTYEAFLYEELWKPSEMEHTGYLRPNYGYNDVAVGYRNDELWGKPTEKWNNEVSWHLKGNGGVLSTVEDMYKWHQALAGTKVLSKASKEKMYTKHIEEGEGAGSYYGYGWAIFPTPRNTNLIAHNGGNGIFFADFWRYLTEDITIIMMTNQANRGYDSLASQLAGIILTPNFKPNTELKVSQADAKTERQIEHILDGFINIIQKNDALAWEGFITKHFSKNMINFMPMKEHVAMFQTIHDTLKGQTISDMMLTPNNDIELKFSKNKMIMNIVVDANSEAKVDGLKVE